MLNPIQSAIEYGVPGPARSRGFAPLRFGADMHAFAEQHRMRESIRRMLDTSAQYFLMPLKEKTHERC